MGTMAQTGCTPAHPLKCGDDIPDSWCTHRFGVDWIPCNKNHAPSGQPDVVSYYCRETTGKCACHNGYCPVNGKCEPAGSFASSTMAESKLDYGIYKKLYNISQSPKAQNPTIITM